LLCIFQSVTACFLWGGTIRSTGCGAKSDMPLDVRPEAMYGEAADLIGSYVRHRNQRATAPFSTSNCAQFDECTFEASPDREP